MPCQDIFGLLSSIFKILSVFPHFFKKNREVGETNGFSYIDLHPSNELTQRFVLQSLHKFTSYQISIQAYNQQGIGPSSATAVATTMEDGEYLVYVFTMLRPT